ncbi:MAG TPA: hypothetical protein VJ970_05105, partial [Flavobacteriaceae bacterium]|nr:hypothetical protein [Flavobacteriaceae bacterium]
MKKVLIITYYWPPAGGSGVQRWLKFVKYFRDFGIEPVIYTVENPNYPIEDTSLVYEIPKDIKVLKQPIWEPNNLFSIFKKNKQSAGFLNPNPSFFGKLLQYIRANYFIPDARKFWIKPSVQYLKEYLASTHINTIITTGPPHSMHLIGLSLKQKIGVKWIADFRDPWTEIDYFHQLPLTKKAIQKHKKLEFEVLKNASAVTVVGNTMKKSFEKVNAKTYVVTNGYDFETNKLNYNLDEKFLLTHIGLMNSDRNHPVFWEAISELIQDNSNLKKDLEINLIGKVANEVNESILKYNLQSKVNLISYLQHNEVVKHQQKSQVLLVFVNHVP